MTNDMMEGTWDARQYFVQEIVYRLHLVLDANYQDPKAWYERLYDFYCICSPIIRERKKEEMHKVFVEKLEKIEPLLFAKSMDGKMLTEQEKAANREKAYKELRLLMMDVHNIVWLSDVYMKRTRRVAPGQAIMEMGF
jgi:hypothetical protein